MKAVPLAEARDAALFGGKAVQLGQALRAGLPVPDGYAFCATLVERVVEGEGAAIELFRRCVEATPGQCAVRSSAVGEDSAEASFAGQHATRLNVLGAAAALSALREVWESGRTESAMAYRRRLNAGGEPQVGVVLQRLVAADMAGVLFTCDPVSGDDHMLVEACWGLGEGVVQGMVVPDRYRMTREGQVLERIPGSKDRSVRLAAGGGTEQRPVPPHLARRLCLGYGDLRHLHAMARRCDAVFGEAPHDIEWAFEDGGLFLLQRRPVTQRAGQQRLA
ncbi:MAG: PEP/pyruvate-binding domain-containing protein [Alsobacter sp.]